MKATAMTAIDITPPAGVYDTFGPLNYKPWYAITELVALDGSGDAADRPLLQIYDLVIEGQPTHALALHLPWDEAGNLVVRGAR